MPCRINKSRLWTGRLILESALHCGSTFVTLTYAPEHFPKDGSVSRAALSAFMKRLRRKVGRGIRFFGVGEYGDQTLRPHYHVVLFGCQDYEAVGCSWAFGHVHCVPVTVELCRYICGYLTKNMTKAEDERLAGKAPEFAQMSLRPGIGAGAAPELARHVNSSYGVKFAATGGVPNEIRFDKKKWPLGRYLRQCVREASGLGQDAYEKARYARSRGFDIDAWAKAFVLAQGREVKRVASGHKARFLKTLRKGKL